MRTLAQFQPSRDENAVNLKARLPFKLKQNVDQALVTRAAAQNPASASQDRACNGPDNPIRLFP